jgi:Family of unknown function (DUF6074)
MTTMTPHGDLPLFAWKPPVKIIAFPAERRVGEARHVARKLVELDGRDKAYDAYWRRKVRDMERSLQQAQIPSKVIEQQIDAFGQAVQHELERITTLEQYRPQPV